ncbi:hypothetical protein [Cohnella hashimotonis]|uniref:Uncharacterized protein n=1 Tax=Cohnella hashimotonis TaxID=2826895 RepID=A0ABT6TTK1_9BACL|nr:hypothetical protein [Cohnella hashimotonis]MDI4650188.1 hypothetical protein [Cohnella hashimotonis]
MLQASTSGWREKPALQAISNVTEATRVPERAASDRSGAAGTCGT